MGINLNKTEQFTQTDGTGTITLTASETLAVIQDTGPFKIAAVQLVTTDQSLANAADEVDFYIQTTYDAGASWVDIGNFHLANADNGSTSNLGMFISLDQSPTAIRTLTTNAITDDTKADVMIGDRLRCNVVFTIGGAPSVTFTLWVHMK